MWLLLVLTMHSAGSPSLDKRAQFSNEYECRAAITRVERSAKHKTLAGCVRSDQLSWALRSIFGGRIDSFWP